MNQSEAEPVQFVATPVLRGFDAIQSVHAIIHRAGGFIAGGYARYCLSSSCTQNLPGDIDVYSSGDASFWRMKQLLKSAGYRVAFDTPVALTLRPPEEGRLKIQLVKPFLVAGRGHTWGSVERVLRNFDLNIVQCAILSDHEGIVQSKFHEDEAEKRLRLCSIIDPASALKRVIKYVNKGYSIESREIVKLFVAWESAPESYKARFPAYLAKPSYIYETVFAHHAGRPTILENSQGAIPGPVREAASINQEKAKVAATGKNESAPASSHETDRIGASEIFLELDLLYEAEKQKRRMSLDATWENGEGGDEEAYARQRRHDANAADSVHSPLLAPAGGSYGDAAYCLE